MSDDHLWRAFSPSLLHLDAAIGMLDREKILNLLFREADRAQRMKTSFCVLLLAIDDFGEGHGQFGGECGDELVRQLGARAVRHLRSYDAIGRYADDTLLFILPGCNTSGARVVIERIRCEMLDAPFTIAGEQIRCGVRACFAMSRGRSPIIVLREAERALDRARRGGDVSMPGSRGKGRVDFHRIALEKLGKDIVR
jgi:diguanylate cyclase (GGDEF)-like protein